MNEINRNLIRGSLITNEMYLDPDDVIREFDGWTFDWAFENLLDLEIFNKEEPLWVEGVNKIIIDENEAKEKCHRLMIQLEISQVHRQPK